MKVRNFWSSDQSNTNFALYINFMNFRFFFVIDDGIDFVYSLEIIIETAWMIDIFLRENENICFISTEQIEDGGGSQHTPQHCVWAMAT